MHVFKDKSGLDWRVEITVATNKQVKALLKYSLYDLVEKGDKPFRPLVELLGDEEKFIDLLYVVCKEQCDELSIADVDFCRVFTGEVLGDAVDAFVAEFLGFFPNRQIRDCLKKAWQKGQELGLMLLEKINIQVASVDLEQALKDLEKKLTEPSGAAPESSESTPTLLRSAS